MNQPLKDVHVQGLKNSENCQLAHEPLKDKFNGGRAGAAIAVELRSPSAFRPVFRLIVITVGGIFGCFVVCVSAYSCYIPL